MTAERKARVYWLAAIAVAGLTFIFADNRNQIHYGRGYGRDIDASWFYAAAFCVALYAAYFQWIRDDVE